MLTLNALIDLFRHMEWADAALWASVLAFEPAKTDGKLKDSLYHLHVAHYAYLRIWRSEPTDAPYPTFGRHECGDALGPGLLQRGVCQARVH
jgi:hypothetical protein